MSDTQPITQRVRRRAAVEHSAPVSSLINAVRRSAGVPDGFILLRVCGQAASIIHEIVQPCNRFGAEIPVTYIDRVLQALYTEYGEDNVNNLVTIVRQWEEINNVGRMLGGKPIATSIKRDYDHSTRNNRFTLIAEAHRGQYMVSSHTRSSMVADQAEDAAIAYDADVIDLPPIDLIEYVEVADVMMHSATAQMDETNNSIGELVSRLVMRMGCLIVTDLNKVSNHLSGDALYSLREARGKSSTIAEIIDAGNIPLLALATTPEAMQVNNYIRNCYGK